MRSFWRQRVPDSGILMGFKNVHFQVPYLCIIKEVMLQSWEEQGTAKIVTLPIIWPNFLLLFWHTLRASSHNAMLARQRYANSGQNFTLCDALVASERRLGP